MYKYQKETMEHIFQAISKIEKMTREVYTIEIGYGEDTCWDGSEYVTHKGKLFVRTNQDNKFVIKEQAYWGTYEHEIGDWYKGIDKVKINQDVFLALNNLIDKVLEDNQQREEFYTILNSELRILIESLKTWEELE